MNPILKHSKPSSVVSDLSIDQNYLRDLVQRLAFPRPVNIHENDRAREIVTEEFRKIPGDEPMIYGNFKNIFQGRLESATILVGAHYDSVPGSPGADDNASAVAVMLAAAHAVAGHANAIFVAFNSEEYGLAGSREFATYLARQGTKLEAVYILEMVGYRDRRANSQRNPVPFLQGVPTTGDFLGVVTNQDALLDRILAGAATCDVPFVGFSLPDVMANVGAVQRYSPNLLRSDHTSFWQHHYPAAMLTDTAEFRNPHYHRRTDTPETLDYAFMAEIAKAVANMLLA